MKKLILILFLGLLIFGCSHPNLENSVPNPETFTKVKHLKMDKDTITVIYEEADDKLILYVYDEESSTIIRQYYLANENSMLDCTVGRLLILCVLMFLAGISMVVIISD